MKTINVTGKGYAINNPEIEDWIVLPRQSSMVAFIATDADNERMMFQWNNGICTIVAGIPAWKIKECESTAPGFSIGKYYHKEIKGKYTETDTQPNSIAEIPDDEGEEWPMTGTEEGFFDATSEYDI